MKKALSLGNFFAYNYKKNIIEKISTNKNIEILYEKNGYIFLKYNSQVFKITLDTFKTFIKIN